MIIQGKAKWAKIVGDPQPAYDKTQKEWSMDLLVDEDAIQKLESVDLGHKVKTNKEGEKFIKFSRKSLKKDQATGEMVPAKPIKIVDKQKEPWDGKTLIGNGSTVNVSFVVNETEYNKKKFKKPGIIAVQVVDLVEHEGGAREDFPEYDEDGTENWDSSED